MHITYNLLSIGAWLGITFSITGLGTFLTAHFDGVKFQDSRKDAPSFINALQAYKE